MDKFEYSENIENYLFQSEIDYIENHKFPELIFEFNKTDSPNVKSKIDVLIEISRLHSDEFITLQEDFLTYAHRNVSILSLLITRGHLDQEYFLNPDINTAKFKLIIACLEDRIDLLIEANPQLGVNSVKKFIINLLKSIVFHLARYNRIAFQSKYSSVEFEIKEHTTPLDKRISEKAPSNVLRIKALKEFCPELWDRLSKSQHKETQKEIIHLITGVNKTDAYKYSFGDRQKQPNSLNAPELSSLLNKLK